MSIFSDFLEESMEVFMDDFTVYGSSFDTCLDNLAKVLGRCIEAHLVLNFEKCHFMVKQGVVLGHIISGEGIAVDRSKIDVIVSLTYPTCVREVRSFLGHAGFYRRFIKDFSKIALPLSKLLQKDIDFQFDDDCRRAFDQLKQHLISALYFSHRIGIIRLSSCVMHQTLQLVLYFPKGLGRFPMS